MPQGKLKVKNKAAVPASKKQKATPKKGLGINKKAKGGRYIAPKKSKLKEAEKLRKGMEIAIKSNIEHDLKERAKKEGKPFKVIHVPKKTAGVIKMQAKSKKKKK